jgi:MFS family permease
MSILSGYLLNSYGWRWMFIIEGLPAIAWALVWWYVSEDDPSKVKWLTPEEKKSVTGTDSCRATGIACCKKLCCHVPFENSYPFIHTIFFMEYRRIRLCDVASFYH